MIDAPTPLGDNKADVQGEGYDLSSVSPSFKVSNLRLLKYRPPVPRTHSVSQDADSCVTTDTLHSHKLFELL